MIRLVKIKKEKALMLIVFGVGLRIRLGPSLYRYTDAFYGEVLLGVVLNNYSYGNSGVTNTREISFFVWDFMMDLAFVKRPMRYLVSHRKMLARLERYEQRKKERETERREKLRAYRDAVKPGGDAR